MAIYEICVVNENLRRLIIRKETGSALKQRATLDGMESLRLDGWRRVLLGQTTVEEVVRVTQQMRRSPRRIRRLGRIRVITFTADGNGRATIRHAIVTYKSLFSLIH
ncbi:MAG: hypothetical protein WDN28_33335 [Chthoniobacter sp.]